MDWERPLGKNFSMSLSMLLTSSLGTDPLVCGLGLLGSCLDSGWLPVPVDGIVLYYSGYGVCCNVSFARYMHWKQREVMFSKEEKRASDWVHCMMMFASTRAEDSHHCSIITKAPDHSARPLMTPHGNR